MCEFCFSFLFFLLMTLFSSLSKSGCKRVCVLLLAFVFSPSLSGCPRARKGGLKLTPNKEEKEEQEMK